MHYYLWAGTDQLVIRDLLFPHLPTVANFWADTMSPSSPTPLSKDDPPPQVNDVCTYKLYKRRFAGLLGIVCHLLRNTAQRFVDRLAKPSSPVSSADLLEHPELRQCHGIPLVRSNRKFEYTHSSLHTPKRKVLIEADFTAAQEFNVSLDRVNWLGNITACIFIPAAALTPWLVSRYGVKRTVRHILCLTFPDDP